MYESTPEVAYATLVFAEYQDTTGRLRYANCGHLPPLILRRDGTLERLDHGSTVLGMFSDWKCTSGETEMTPGDTLLLFTDGVTEATNKDGGKFGEAGLIGAVRARQDLPIDQLQDRIIEKVSTFSGREQEDDITLVVARSRFAE